MITISEIFFLEFFFLKFIFKIFLKNFWRKFQVFNSKNDWVIAVGTKEDIEQAGAGGGGGGGGGVLCLGAIIQSKLAI